MAARPESYTVRGGLVAVDREKPQHIDEVAASAESLSSQANAAGGADGLSRREFFGAAAGLALLPTEATSPPARPTSGGYRAAVQGKVLQLQLGFSHEIKFAIPDGIAIKCEKPTSITITGADKQKVGQVAAEIREMRGPEPYKGKGVKYAGEYIFRKEGKKK